MYALYSTEKTERNRKLIKSVTNWDLPPLASLYYPFLQYTPEVVVVIPAALNSSFLIFAWSSYIAHVFQLLYFSDLLFVQFSKSNFLQKTLG